MRIGIDARLWGNSRSGIARYTRSLIEALRRVAPDERLVLYVDRPHEDLPADVETHCLPERRRLVWTLRDLPRSLASHPVDLYHAVTGFELPPGRPARLVTTVHDLVPYRFPGSVPWRHRLFVRWLLPGALRRADRVIAVSGATRDEIVERFRTDPGKIRVVHEAAEVTAVRTPQGAAGPAGSAGAVGARYGLDGPYLLFVGNLEPKKNLPTLLRAVARLRERGTLGQTSLALVGMPAWGVPDLGTLAASLGLDETVRLLGTVPDGDLQRLYAGATAFVFPSLWEGFGLPVIEAMAAGTPVVASRRGAIPEITAGAALLVEPDEESLAGAIARVLSEPQLRETLRVAGRARAADFSWERTARETLAVYREAIS